MFTRTVGVVLAVVTLIECGVVFDTKTHHSNVINPHLRQAGPVGAYSNGCDIGANQLADIPTATCLFKSYPAIMIYRTNACHQSSSGNATVVFDTMLCKNLDAIYSQQTGYSTFNLYYEACPKATASPTAQMTALFSYLSNTCNHAVGIVYINVDGTPGDSGLNKWFSNTTKNVAMINEYINGWQSASGGRAFMYSAQGPWKAITANDQTFNGLYLWYAHNDNTATVADWATYNFGGWTTDKLVSKQYKASMKTNCTTNPSFYIGADIWLTA